MRVFHLIVPVFAGLLFVSPAPAGHAEAPATPPFYVAPAVLPPVLLPPPPAEGSPAWREQLAGVLIAQQHVSSAADVAALRAEQKVGLGLITETVSANFTAERYPKTFALLNRVLTDSTLITEADKKYWHTRRPYLTDPHVKLLIDPIDASPAYPSGHTAETRVLAEVLGLLLPQKRDALRARAEEVARHRVEAGVHYPADIEGGRLLAMLIVGAMIRSTAFGHDFEAAHEELGRLKPY